MFKSLFVAIPTSLMGFSVTGLSILIAPQVSLAQTSIHSSHHHWMIGRDNLVNLTSGGYSGSLNPNYNRLSLLFPHQHDPISTSGLHPIGIYSYTGPADNPTILPTNTNNELPEKGKAPALSLTRGTGVFNNKMVSGKTEDNMYSDLKIRPLAHLQEDFGDPFVDAIYNAGNGRWNDLLGENAAIAIELVAVSDGLGIANAQGQDLFNNIGDTYQIGQGDNLSFLPVLYAAPSMVAHNYSATLRFVDLNNNWLPSGTFSVNVQTTAVPEPLTIMGSMAALGFSAFLKRKQAKVQKDQEDS